MHHENPESGQVQQATGLAQGAPALPRLAETGVQSPHHVLSPYRFVRQGSESVEAMVRRLTMLFADFVGGLGEAFSLKKVVAGEMVGDKSSSFGLERRVGWGASTKILSGSA